MSDFIITERSNIVAIADAVRGKTGSTNNLNLGEIVSGINSITGSGGINTSDATATSAHILSPYTAYAKGSKVTGSIQSRSAQTITPNNNTQTIPSGVYLSGVQTINPVPTQEKTVTSNGVVTPDSGKYLSKVTVNVASSGGGTGGIDTSDATATAGDILSGKTAYVDGEKITGTITTKTSSNLTASGATVSVPAGYYASNASKSVSTATQATPTISVSESGLITASSTQSAGYVSSGTKSATNQLTTQAAKTVTPSTSSQTAVASGVYTTGAITVGAIPSSYIQPSGTLTITTNGTHDVKNYASATVNVASSGGITVPSTITAGDTPVLVSSTMAYTCTSTSMTKTGISVTVPRAGTYRFKFSCGRTNTSGTWTAQLYKNGSAVSGATATWSSYQGTYNGTVTCSAGDTIEIYARSRGSSYRLIVGHLTACIDWDTGF